jgi:hypothetical protein
LKKKILLVATVILISVGLLGITKIVQDKYLNKNTDSVLQEEKDSKSEEVVVKEKDIQKQTGKEEADKVQVVKEDVKPVVKEQETKAVVENKTTDTKTTSTENVVVAKKAVPVKKEVVPVKTEPKKEAKLIIRDEISVKTILSINVNIENSTVADITRNELDNKGISYRTTGRGETTYFTMINGLTARGDGALSGWCYYVNGDKPGVSCGAYKLKTGDVVEWKYLKDAVNN